MEDNPLIRDAVRRHIDVLETANPDGPEFRRAKAVVEAYRHEEVMSAHKEKIASDKKLTQLTSRLLTVTCGLFLLTLVLAVLTIAIVRR